MKKIILFVVLILIISIPSGFYINQRIKITNLNEKLQSAIGKDQGITETILKVENESSTMSFSELFDLCDKSVKERTDVLIELRGLYPNLESTLKDSLIEFLNAENELIRSKSQSYRKYLDVSTGSKSYDRLIQSYRSSDYMRDYYKREIFEKTQDMIKDAEEMKDDVQNFIDKFNILIEKEKCLAKIMQNENLRFSPIFSKYQESNLKFMNNSMKYADSQINEMNELKQIVDKWGY